MYKPDLLKPTENIKMRCNWTSLCSVNVIINDLPWVCLQGRRKEHTGGRDCCESKVKSVATSGSLKISYVKKCVFISS